MEKVAMVTGAGSGIGRAVARRLAQDGFHVVLAGRRKEALQTTAAEIETAGQRALAVATDIGRPAEVKALFDEADAMFGRLDMLFNNAGIGAPSVEFDELTDDQWQAVVDVNLTGAFLCSRHAFAMMKRQQPMGGRIVNNGSISAETPRPLSAPYTATKHAITGLTKSIALDGRPYDIACGQIDIGNAATEMTEKMTQGMPQPNGQIMPEPRMDVEHVAQAVSYMAGLPLASNVLFMTVMATKMPFVGRG
jgi:NAD(P)-dependent dehydrogenase (short-subunit alcohol dehydrogenase family)